jgi:glycosyltransferase involved in cell wall biosynthesis/peptidoglycan/xylan/chitin deacetylase (PgdA/CDA1 family)
MQPPDRPPIRIAHVVLSLACGGLERVVVDLARYHRAHGLETAIICLDGRGDLADEAERAGVPVLVVKREPGLDPGLVRRLAAVLRDGAYTCVHTHSLDPMFYAGAAAWRAGVRIRVHSQHNTMLAAYRLSDRLKFRLAQRFFTHVVGVSAETTRLIARFGVPAGRRLTVLNGIDCDTFDAATRTPFREDRVGGGSIGAVARLAPEKGLDRLVEAFARVRNARPAAQLTLVGDGPERARLESLAARLGLGGSVIFTGRQENVRPWLAGFDVFALPSLTEGIPLALLEAMAVSVPVVASDVGGIPEVVNSPACGRLVPPGDPCALEQALTELLGNPGARDALGRAGAVRVRQAFSLRSMAAGYRAIYSDDSGGTLTRRAIRRTLQAMLPRRLATWRGSGAGGRVAVTFDDGPIESYTSRILDVLRAEGVKATFFLVGERVAAQPGLLQRIVTEGHEVANHSYSHPHFDRLGFRAALAELDRTAEILEVGPAPARFFRPPRGSLSLSSLAAAWHRKLTVVLWTVDLKDYKAVDAAEIVAMLRRRRISAGDIILYHGNSDAALDALPAVLSAVRASGLTCVPVSEL